jgi:hypothetical protein
MHVISPFILEARMCPYLFRNVETFIAAVELIFSVLKSALLLPNKNWD